MQVSKVDTRARLSTGRLSVYRLLQGSLSALCYLVASPVLLIVYLLREKTLDLAHQDEDPSIRELTTANLTFVIPMADFCRLGLQLKNIADRDRRFVLMNHVFWDWNITAPVGVSLDPGYAAPLQDFPQLNLVRDGFTTDFASIPAILQWLVGKPLGSYIRAAVIHDWAYANHHDGSHKGRQDCDKAMLALMRQDKTEPWRRTLIYLGLRIGGGPAFYCAPKTHKKIESALNNSDFRYHFVRAQGFICTYVCRQHELVGILPEGTTDRLLADYRSQAESMSMSAGRDRD